MADNLNLKDESKPFPKHPEGQAVAQCVDVINLGECVSTFPGSPTTLTPKFALVFRSGEKDEQTGKYLDVSVEFSAFFSPKANARKFLESWRGKAYTDDEAKESGIPVHKLVGAHALLTIEHKPTKKGGTWAHISSCVPVPKMMRDNLPDFRPTYTRDEWWGKKQAQNAEEATKYRAEIGAILKSAKPKDAGYEDFPTASDLEENDLPFD